MYVGSPKQIRRVLSVCLEKTDRHKHRTTYSRTAVSGFEKVVFHQKVCSIAKQLAWASNLDVSIREHKWLSIIFQQKLEPRNLAEHQKDGVTERTKA